MPKEHYVIRGKRYPVPDPDSWTFKERSEVKAFTGLPWGQVQRALVDRDPDVEFILMRLAILRVDPGADVLADLAALPDGDWDLITEDELDPPDGPAEAGDQDDDEDTGDAGEQIRRRASRKRAAPGPGR